MTALLFLALTVGAEPVPPLAVDLPVVDKGELHASKPLLHVFRLKNTTELAMTITEVSTACGCFRTELSEKILRPGQVIDLTVGINLLTQPEGKNSWKLTVRYRQESNPPISGERTLTLSARVRKDVVVEPVALVLISEKEIAGTLTVTDRRGKPLKVTAARVGLPQVTTEVRPAREEQGQRSQSILVSVGKDCPAGQHSDEICIDTDDPEYRELRIPLRIIKKSAESGVQAVPSSVHLRFARDQATASYLLRLRDPDDGEVQVDKVECDHPAVACKWAAGPGSMATLRVIVDRDKANAAALGLVSVHLKGPKPQTILIPVSWTLPPADKIRD